MQNIIHAVVFHQDRIGLNTCILHMYSSIKHRTTAVYVGWLQCMLDNCSACCAMWRIKQVVSANIIFPHPRKPSVGLPPSTRAYCNNGSGLYSVYRKIWTPVSKKPAFMSDRPTETTLAASVSDVHALPVMERILSDLLTFG